MALFTFISAIFAIIGLPLFMVIAGIALFGFYQSDTDLSVIAIEIFRLAEMPVLLAIPLFTFAGYLLSEGNAPSRLVKLTQVFLGWMPGGLAIVSLTACAFFTAFTGASGVTIIALGALLYPALTESGYKEKFSLGLVTTSGSLGLLFAPSLPLILYGIIAQQMNLAIPVSIEDLFLAGILPGFLMLFVLTAWSIFQGRSLEKGEKFTWKAARKALWDAKWEIPLPFLILAGIYGGFLAVSEVAAVTALYVLMTEVFILREISLRQLPAITRKAMTLVGSILVILGVSMASTNYMIDSGVPEILFNFVQEHVSSRIMFLLVLNIFLLVLGALLDIFSALVLVVPLILPVAMQYGIHPVHLGIIFLANMQLGYLTPPVGMNLFISGYRFEKSIIDVYKSTLPFFFLLILCVLLITYIPQLSLLFL